MDFLLDNIEKYIVRSCRKDGVVKGNKKQDLRKALWYTDWLMEHIHRREESAAPGEKGNYYDRVESCAEEQSNQLTEHARTAVQLLWERRPRSIERAITLQDLRTVQWNIVQELDNLENQEASHVE